MIKSIKDLRRIAAKLTYKMWLDGDITEERFLTALNSKGDISYPKSKQEREQLNNEYQKIQAKQKELFEEKVNIDMDKLICVFNKKLELSKDTSRLVKDKIETIENLLFPEKLKIEKTCSDSDWIDLGNWHCTVRTIKGVRDFYKKHIRDGEPIDYYYVQSPNVKEVDYDDIKEQCLLLAINYSEFLNWLKEKKDISPSTAKREQPGEQEPVTPETLDDCFGDGNADTYIDILKRVNPPVINKKGFYNLGGHQKGCITAWVQIMRNKGKIQGVTDGVLAELLNKKIPGLNLGKDGRTLRNLETTYYIKYHPKILAYIE